MNVEEWSVDDIDQRVAETRELSVRTLAAWPS
jgi:hypothetical protein